MRLGRPAEIDGATAGKRHDVARATGFHHLLAKTFIGVARYKLLRLPDRDLNRFCIERFRLKRFLSRF